MNNVELSKIKYIANIYTGNSIPDDDKDKFPISDTTMPYISSKEINATTSFTNYDTDINIEKSNKRFKNAFKESTLLCIEGGSAGKKITYLTRDVAFVNKLCCFQPTSGIDGKYLFYLLQSDDFLHQFYENMSGMIGGVSVGTLKNFVVHKHNYGYQKKIADYLDKKVSAIDKAIENAEKEIETVKEYKISLIDSKINKKENNWKYHKILYGLEMPITDGPHTTPELFDTGVAFVSAEAVSCGRGKIDFNHIRGYISEKFYKECCLKYIPKINDVYMIKSGATTGKVAIVDTLYPKFTIWSPLAVMRANVEKINPKYLFYVLQSNHVQKQVELAWSFGTQQNLGMRELEKIKIAIPPLSEQQEIVDYLDKKCSAIDKLIDVKTKKLETLKEYKKSLIYECVTGKKEVM